MLLGMATGESLACLNHRMQGGEASRDIDNRRVAWYRDSHDLLVSGPWLNSTGGPLPQSV